MSDWSRNGDEAFGGDDRDAFDRSRPSLRAQRLLVRVLLALRGEARRAANPLQDQLRAEQLADRIMAEFPRRVLPVGLAAMVVIVVCASFPLVRDVLPDAAGGAQPIPVATAVEAGLRQRGEAMSDGLEALRAIVGPFAAPGFTAEARDTTTTTSEEERNPSSSEAAAPFQKS